MKHEPQKKIETPKKADQYNDPSFNYLNYWEERGYEHAAEELAINNLLKDKHFKKAVDKVVLAEPSQQQLDIAREFLKDHPAVDRKLMQADDLDFKNGEVDLITMIRVMHHLPDPTAEFKEISRVLSADGYAVIEVANYTHARNRIRHILKHTKMPLEPVNIRTKNVEGEVAFVNHNPHTIIKQLAHAGLTVDRILSVSNLRSPALKKVVPRRIMLAVEGILQPTLANSFFGPSVFFFVRKG
jgi:SAM-dependent methyltransferase